MLRNLIDEVTYGTDGSGSLYDFGVTQEDINTYAQKAKNNDNDKDYLKYAMPSERLINDVKNEIDIKNYIHTLRDNDIRHIYNSHGENTNEKYPVTESDIEQIPNIVENYDKVFVVEHNGKYDSIYYVKVADDGLIYYLEQATDKYHNENLLVNKQMIKTGLDSIPDIKGLKESINKKESSSQYLADLRKIHEEYARSVKENYSVNSIAKVPTKVKDMSAGQLERVYSLLKGINLCLQDASKQIREGEQITNYELGMDIIGEQDCK